MELSLFKTNPISILPYDGEAFYYGKVIAEHDANIFLEKLLNEIAWENDQVKIFGKTIVTKRQVGWYGDMPFKYHYSHSSKVALPLTSTLLSIKSIIEEVSQESYNSCLLNLYRDGDVGIGWHSDDERELKKHGAIGSVSLGSNRKFVFRNRKNFTEKYSTILENGSCLVMKGTTQENWAHTLPVSKKIEGVRINLTFRTIDVAVE